MTGTNVTVVGPRAIADLTFPVTVPLMVLLPKVASMVGPLPPYQRPPVWTLTRSVGGQLNLRGTVRDNQIVDGETLCLVDASSGLREPAVRDLVEMVSDATDQRRRWSPATTRVAAAAAVVAIAFVLAAVASLHRAAIGVGGLSALALGLVSVIRAARRELESPVAVLLSLAVIVLSAGAGAVAGVLAVGGSGGLAGPLMLGGATGTLIGGTLTWCATSVAGGVAVAALTVAVPASAVGVAIWAGASSASAAAVVGYLWLLGLGPAPTVAAGLAQLLALPDRGGQEHAAEVQSRQRAADRYLDGMLWGLAAVVGVSEVLLAASGDVWSLILAALLGVGLLMGGRSFSAMTVVIVPITMGALALLTSALLVALAADHSSIVALVGVVLALAGAVAVTLVRLTPEVRTQLKIWLGRGETLVLFVGPVMVLGVLGVYKAVADAVT